MSSFLKLVGEQLRVIRESKRLTQSQVAELTGSMGMSKSRISDIERGQTNISLNTLELIMNALEITPDELFNFQKLAGVMEIEEKKIILDVHHSLLKERELDEIKYVVRTAKDFLDTVDGKKK
ncbi:helix-turn-helix transcriptional regulator [Psychrobacillus sp.]|uniref:helix-turn-helix domain-containing protein n=1 Tax=Psychrobacillus sp. TaxID=1871623 RepID=UPI0028BF2A09|nr:helix-turn-helix transcriptional regulator [Psychrobacillus sp.]